ncbi:T9SS type A sorting domain-containing protein [Luteirhabdus pelagi]|uniref:T9SS type A sorting domain-containing protein n=1 Tax=Luteirhabdus pelagi TaxID=2792783 RepID=UPI0019394962|nr:T9SS type A sorting domain-containing protein [Luteirhabdus pelagi]
MIRIYLVLFFALFFNLNSFGQEININIISPSNNQVVSGDLYVQVSINATYDISIVEASINSDITELDSQGNNLFDGTISLSNLSQGINSLQINATDLLNNTSSEDIVFIYDTRPELNVMSPLDHSVARPELLVEYEGNDIEGDLPVMLTYNVNIIDQGGSVYSLVEDSNTMVSEVFDLSDFVNTEVTLLLKVTDIRNQTTSVRRQIYVDTSNSLSIEHSVQNEIMDFDGSNLLFVTRDYFWSSLYGDYMYEIKSVAKEEISTGTITDIPLPTNQTLLDRYESFKLIAQGAIIKAGNSEALNGKRNFIWNLNSNITTEIGYTGIADYDNENHIVIVDENSIVQNNLLFSLYVCEYIEIDPGTYLQQCQPHYFIQDISNPTNVNFLEGFHGQNSYDEIEKIFSNGDILYYNNGNILLKTNESIENITTDPVEVINQFAKSDGNIFVYVKNYQNNYSIVLNDGIQEIELREPHPQFLWPEDFKINNGYIAYRTKGNLGQELIKLRKPTGETITVAPFGTDSIIEALNELGEVIFINNDKRYLFSQNNIFQISDNYLGSPYYFNNNWYISIGNTLFYVDQSALSNQETLITQNNKIIVFPNPASEEINIKFDYELNDENLQFSLSNIIGQTILKGELFVENNNFRKIHIMDLKPGIYFLNIYNSGNSVLTKKIIKK